MSTPSVLILGAQGRFGSAAAHAFSAAGWRVFAQARRGDLNIPLTDTEALADAARGARAVVYAVNPLYTRWDAEMLPLARAGMAVAERLGATFMLPGNVYNFGEGMPARLDEATPERPTTAKGRLRVQLEAELAERAASGLRSVVIRAGDFYGHGQGSWLDLLIAKKLQSGRLSYPGPLDVPHAWAYLPDLARAFVRVAETTPEQMGARFECLHFAGHTVTGHDWLAALTEVAWEQGWLPADGALRTGTLPWGMMRLLSPFNATVASLLEMRYLWDVPHALDGAALARRIGAEPHTPFLDAVRAAITQLDLAPRAANSPGPGAGRPITQGV